MIEMADKYTRARIRDAEKEKKERPERARELTLESVYFIMKDGTRFRKTNNYEELVYVDIENLEKELKTSEKNYKIEDIAVIIHNHFVSKKFAPDDIKQYRKFKKHGFNGRFLLYCHRTNKTYDITKLVEFPESKND
ncbi:unnamed protein product [marine sediment metagenome]|uniref:RadC-like JAB domain-containing protein n=1 Tax=marine sediment metagenome TaxID=412755 RepID=X1MHQ8_9ZZZZ